MHPYGYLRKSRVTTDRHVSWEVQETAVREMAGEEVVILSDWNKSGRKGADRRPGYRALLDAIEAGEVSVLYSYSLSRLSRSISDFARLVELCNAHDVPIHLYVEKHLDFSTASGRLMVNILAAFAQMEAEIASERARDTIAVRRARGDHIGPKPFADAELVVAAFEETGSYAGTAKALTRQGVPTRNGLAVWTPTAVHTIIARTAPELMPLRPTRGAKKAAPFLFYRLLECHCGRTLTGVRDARGYASYRCLMGRFTLDHKRQSVPETVVLKWAKEEASHLRRKSLRLVEANRTKEKTLRERTDRLRRVYVDGLMSEAEYANEKAAIDQELAELATVSRSVQMPPVTWDGVPPEKVNAALRLLWRRIKMDESLRPIEAEWYLPHLRDQEAPAIDAARED